MRVKLKLTLAGGWLNEDSAHCASRLGTSEIAAHMTHPAPIQRCATVWSIGDDAPSQRSSTRAAAWQT